MAFADDTLIDRWGKNLSDIIAFMQQDINSLCRWFESNKLSISKTKSCCMLIGSQQKIAKFENLDSLTSEFGPSQIGTYKLGPTWDHTNSDRNEFGP